MHADLLEAQDSLKQAEALYKEALGVLESTDAKSLASMLTSSNESMSSVHTVDFESMLSRHANINKIETTMTVAR